MKYRKRNIFIRTLYLFIAVAVYFYICFRKKSISSSIVLCYHGIPQTSKSFFEWQIKHVNSHAMQISTNAKHVNMCPKIKPVPVLEKYRTPAIVFAVVNNLGETPSWKMPAGHPESDERIMTAEQLVSLSKNSLIKIGSHTLTHPDLTAISHYQVKTELLESKKQLETIIGYAVEDIALPYGAYNQAVLNIAQEEGYKYVHTLDPKLCDLESGETVIGRFSMSPDVWKIEFILTCSGAYAWLRPWRRFIHHIRDRIYLSRK